MQRALVASLSIGIYAAVVWAALTRPAAVDFGAWPSHPIARRFWIGWLIFLFALSPLTYHAGDMSVVYCPRTHAYFDHQPYPLAKMLAAGVQVALGTDSRASNPDLSLWREMQHVASHHAAISRQNVLELGTLAGARALGQATQFGTLEAGKLANLAIVPLADQADCDPHELLLSAAGPTQVFWRGRSA